MPRALKRFHHTGHSHFITFSCYQRRAYLSTPETRSLVEDGLERTRSRYGLRIYGYVVMPEHVHILMSEPQVGTVADEIKAWKLSVTLRQIKRPFWEQRYYDFNVFSNDKWEEKLKYLHRNPVRRGLVSFPENWPWSSFSHYSHGETGTVKISSTWMAFRSEAAEPTQPGSENPDPGHLRS